MPYEIRTSDSKFNSRLGVFMCDRRSLQAISPWSTSIDGLPLACIDVLVLSYLHWLVQIGPSMDLRWPFDAISWTYAWFRIRIHNYELSEVYPPLNVPSNVPSSIRAADNLLEPIRTYQNRLESFRAYYSLFKPIRVIGIIRTVWTAQSFRNELRWTPIHSPRDSSPFS